MMKLKIFLQLVLVCTLVVMFLIQSWFTLDKYLTAKTSFQVRLYKADI